MEPKLTLNITEEILNWNGYECPIAYALQVAIKGCWGIVVTVNSISFNLNGKEYSYRNSFAARRFVYSWEEREVLEVCTLEFTLI